MMANDISTRRTAQYIVPALSAFLAGLAAYLFVFTNKLLNLDEIAGLFSKGESLSSGRWALALTSYVFPDVSMPWINGMLSLIMLVAAACITVRVFEIKSGLIKAILAALMVVFPSQIVTFSYMFTCAPYALALLLAVLSLCLVLCTEDKRRFAAGALLLAFSLGIYQAYLAVPASFCVVYLIKLTLDGERNVCDIIHTGLECLFYLLLSLALYYVINKLAMAITHTEYNSYADASFQTDVHSVLFGIRVAFTAFLGYFYRGYYHLVATPFSAVLHFVCLALVGYELAAYVLRCRDKARAAFLVLLLLLVPFSVNCLYIVSSQRHTLMLYSFVSVYVLACVVCESVLASHHHALRDALCLAMAAISLCNIFYANRLYLKMKLEYENAYEFYSNLTSRIKETPGYDEDTMVVITGDAHELLHESNEIDTSDLVGIMEGLVNVYSRNDFLTYYAGFAPPTIDWAQWEASGAAAEVETMPIYPYDGSIKQIADFIVVKLG